MRLDATQDGRVRLRFGHGPELLEPAEDGSASNGRTRVFLRDGALVMARPQENLTTTLQAAAPGTSGSIAGQYRCAELDATLTITEAGGVAYGGFGGFLGQGRMELLEPIAQDLWALPCPRALDHTPPGDWTLDITRYAAGVATGVTLGCWLARGLRYRRV
jgi:D-aminopeptidase